MKSQFNNIFMERDPVSQQQMEAYLDGKLTPSEMHEIELKLDANDMSTEALEGFQAHPEALAGLEQVRTDFRKKLAKKKTWTQSHTLVAAVAVAVIVLGGAFFASSYKPAYIDANVAQNNNDSTNGTGPEQVLIVISEPVLITEEIEFELDEAKELPQDQQLTSDQIEYHQPITVMAPLSMPVEQLDSLVQKAITLEPLEPLIKEMPDAITPAKVVKSNIKVLYLHQFLVVDYTNLYSDGIEKKILDASGNGTPANFANKDDRGNEIHNDPIYKTTYIPYIDFLRDAQLNYKKNKYKTALKDYHKILKQHPKDVNALFYGGLCYYNLNKQERAIQYFENVVNNSVNTFHPEGEFYKALSLRALGKLGKGNGLLLRIAEEGGFYAEQARDILDQ
ncbi:MAG: tetratricopeptide repeat protein [Flavobacteriales bacterium]|nr:tetratricopeptide repeat protein [Flavobacteriales bacterium]